MAEHVCTECGKPATCLGLYQGKKCVRKKECESVLELCEDSVDKACCDEHCNHSFENTHCHKLKPPKPLTKMTPEEVHTYIRGILHEHSKDTRRKRAKGICVEPDCNAPALNDRTKLFFGDDHCEEHAKEAELSLLIEDQKDDEKGRLR